ncbi:MAG TPA: hypothetical protein VFU60_05215 [Ktedonobacterales bacterium]|nr:hypothetical protein [Ktedonobacterales bacterium]
MDDLNVLRQAAKYSHDAGASRLPFNLPPWGKHTDEADEQLLMWRRINDDANAAYGALLAYVRKAYETNLPDKSHELLKRAAHYATHVSDKQAFADIGDMLGAYLVTVANRDAQTRKLVDAYIARMRALVEQSRVLAGDARPESGSVAATRPDQSPADQPAAQPVEQRREEPPAAARGEVIPASLGYIPRQASGEVTQLEEQLQLTQAHIGRAQEQLAALSAQIENNPQRYVSRKTYEALLHDFNATQNAQWDRDRNTVNKLIKAIADARTQYGIGEDVTSAATSEEQVRFERAVNALTLRLESLLEEQFGIERMQVEMGAPFNPEMMAGDGSQRVTTHESALDGKVARVVAHGYWWRRADGGQQVFQKAKVIRFAFSLEPDELESRRVGR